MRLIDIESIFAIMLASILYCSLANAAEVQWNDRPYSLYAKQDSLHNIITRLAVSAGVPVDVSESVDDIISVKFDQLSRQEIFQQLVNAYGLTWYYDGNRLYVDRLENTQSKTIKLNSLSVAAFKKYLQKLGLIDGSQHVQWQSIDNKRLVYISGPSPFIEKVSEMATMLDGEEEVEADTVYRWVDASGVTHFSSDAGEAPSQSMIYEIQTSHISRLNNPANAEGNAQADASIDTAATNAQPDPSEVAEESNQEIEQEAEELAAKYAERLAMQQLLQTQMDW